MGWTPLYRHHRHRRLCEQPPLGPSGGDILSDLAARHGATAVPQAYSLYGVMLCGVRGSRRRTTVCFDACAKGIAPQQHYEQRYEQQRQEPQHQQKHQQAELERQEQDHKYLWQQQPVRAPPQHAHGSLPQPAATLHQQQHKYSHLPAMIGGGVAAAAGAGQHPLVHSQLPMEQTTLSEQANGARLLRRRSHVLHEPKVLSQHIHPMAMPPTVTKPGNADPAAVAEHHRQSQRGPDPFAKHQRVSTPDASWRDST